MGSSFDSALILEYLPLLAKYLPLTLLILISSIVLGCLIGVALAIPRLYKWPVFNKIAVVYISFFRGTPIIIQLMFVFYAIPELMRIFHIELSGVPPIIYVIVTLGLHSGASLSESFRAAVNSVDRGQVEAAYAIGLSPYRAFSRIVLPQAIRVVMPHFSNAVMACLKDTSLAFSIGVLDMVGRGITIGNISFHLLEVYLALGIIYYFVSVTIGIGLQRIENVLQRNDRSLQVR